MPSTPLDPRPDRAPLDPTAVPSVEAAASTREASAPDAAASGLPTPDAAPVDVEAERARWRDRRTGLIALVVVTIALWAVIAAAIGFATTM
ncbi:hypothetical protein [Clavibacter capsici]|uniref:Uncharacterized protein n=1 Tax=Clavibacter capsici TaxID=1874630 RepID=A0AAE6XR18_9MICO|nr:hypothetical protein [Clavibacter capsici]ALD12722.1 hypothetical protein AES38_07175 [Clavibacter capsici]QIS44885.1 hypothetical protein GW570_07200 [Clavibacter capsici]